MSLSMNSTSLTEALPANVGFFWALPTTTGKWEYGHINRITSSSAQSVSYETGVATGGFQTLGLGTRFALTKDTSLAERSQTFTVDADTGFFALNELSSAEGSTTTVDAYWNIDKSRSLVVSTTWINFVFTRTNVEN